MTEEYDGLAKLQPFYLFHTPPSPSILEGELSQNLHFDTPFFYVKCLKSLKIAFRFLLREKMFNFVGF